MPKQKSKIYFQIEPYASPRNYWRKQIHSAASIALNKQNMISPLEGKLEINVVLFLESSATEFHDVDNRLKDVLDALQGRMGGPKAEHRYRRLIENDNQVFRATITRKLKTKKNKSGGHVTISVPSRGLKKL